MRFVILLTTLLLAPLTAQESLETRLTSVLTERLGEMAPGLQAAVVLPDGALISIAVGHADREKKLGMPTDGKLLAGSTGKTFFAALACQLVREKVLDLDARVAALLPDDAWVARLPNGSSVTVRHLLMHRSGIMRYEFDPAFLRELLARPDHRFTPLEELAFVFDAKPRFAAGAGFEYSDTNYILLGIVMERRTGTSCYEEIQRRFLGPLGLRHTVPAVGRSIDGLLPSYAGRDNPFGNRDAMLVDGKLPFDPAFEWAGGGFATTASDLAVWAANLYGGDVLGDLKAQVVTGEPAPLGKQTRYGLGCIVDSTPLGPAFGHRGFFPGSLSEMRYYPDARIAVALLANCSADRRLSRLLPEWADELARLAKER